MIDIKNKAQLLLTVDEKEFCLFCDADANVNTGYKMASILKDYFAGRIVEAEETMRAQQEREAQEKAQVAQQEAPKEE